jgi:hypothetical protein
MSFVSQKLKTPIGGEEKIGIFFKLATGSNVKEIYLPFYADSMHGT